LAYLFGTLGAAPRRQSGDAGVAQWQSFSLPN
jgi:hypothetical protein